MNHSGTIAGKLNGVIAATTPTGWLKLSTSIPRETPSSVSPLSRWGAAMAASTDSMPRPISAKASGTVLPMSVATSRASSSWWATSTWRRSIRARARASTGVAAHSGWAARAAATARSTSAAPERGTRARSSPVAGLRVTSISSALGDTHAPPT